MTITVRFWGVRGSVPTPLTNPALQNKIVRALQKTYEHPLPESGETERLAAWIREHLDFSTHSTFGGNTTCLEVRCDGELIILDMGTGLRGLGGALMPEIFGKRGIKGSILQSHVHWDHIQGFPFWGPLYLPRTAVENHFTFFGGKEWDAQLELVLAGQMNTPVFPVSFGELRHTSMHMEFQTVWDGWSTTLPGPKGPIRITARKLNHPQETFGYRIEYAGQTVAFTTDHEPYAAGIPVPLLALVDKADLWITDCQYTHDMYVGKMDKVQRLGWGHSYPAYIAAVAREGLPKRVLTTHHDPSSSDEAIQRIASAVADDAKLHTDAAYEGLVVELG